MEKVKQFISRVVVWLVGYWAFIVQMFHDSQPTEAEREANRRRREQERQKAEAQRQQSTQAQAQEDFYRTFAANVAPCLHLELFNVAYRWYSRMGVLQPSTLAQLSWRIVKYNRLPFLSVALIRAELTPLSQSSLDTIRDLVQALINEDLMGGMVEGCPCAYYFQGVPAIVVDSVRAEGPRLVFTLGATYSPAAAQRWQAQQAAQPMPTAPADPFDDVL